MRKHQRRKRERERSRLNRFYPSDPCFKYGIFDIKNMRYKETNYDAKNSIKYKILWLLATADQRFMRT